MTKATSDSRLPIAITSMIDEINDDSMEYFFLSLFRWGMQFFSLNHLLTRVSQSHFFVLHHRLSDNQAIKHSPKMSTILNTPSRNKSERKRTKKLTWCKNVGRQTFVKALSTVLFFSCESTSWFSSYLAHLANYFNICIYAHTSGTNKQVKQSASETLWARL